jgi:amino acid adenylation domain-containing protein/FkbH-like protein
MIGSPTKTNDNVGLEQKRAALAARLQQAVAQPRQSPLSFAQQRLWFLDQFEPNSPLYNIGAMARIEGAIDSGKLEQAFATVISRHESLRTRFACPDETPVQIIDPPGRFELKRVDLRQTPEELRQNEAQRFIQLELNRPFNLTSDYPIRVALLQLGFNEHILILTLHHIVADEWSLRVLFNELKLLYSGYVTGKAAALPELSIQYSDYGRWQRQWLQGEPLREQLTYWKSQLEGYPPLTELPTDRPRASVPTFRGKTIKRELGLELSEKLKNLGRSQEATLFMVLLAAFKALVCRYTQQEDLIICSPVAGRNRLETENLIGFFVNTLALRTSLAGDPSFTELLGRVRQTTLGAMAHQDLPFDRLVEELQPERTLTHLPFTKLMFSFQAAVMEQLELPGALVQFVEVESEWAKFDLTLILRETSRGLAAIVEFNQDLFEAASLDRLLGHFEVLLEGIVAAPERRLSELPLLGFDERQQVLVDWNATSKPYPRDHCIHELFEAQALRSAEATAVLRGNQRMSYGELNSRANQLARFLRQFDIKPDVPVGLCLARSPEMLVAMLGILKAGGAYVPLDANYPRERLAFMLSDCGAPVILTQQRLLGRVPHEGVKVICLDADWELIAREQRENTASLANARNLAYIMYTSGSTGRPKGVAVPHRAVNRLVINNDFIRIDPTDRIAQVSNISFDAATFEIWGALLNGAQLVGITRDVALSPKDFAAELREQGITAMFLTAALFNQVANESPGAFETLKTVIAGGEALDPKWVRAVLKNRPPQRLLNGYGPTENTTFTCCHTIAELPVNAFNVPIGRPISNTTVYILDRHLHPVPIGVAGELYTGGDGLARGYWRRPELTAERFIPNPFDPERASVLYKTGDLARFLPSGAVEFLGRIDDQVKIRGFRIELGEIETLLGKHPGVRECVVTVCGSSAAEKRLVAYVAAALEPAPNASELRAFLSRQLPDYMVPSAFEPINALPLTPNGKVDRQALPEPDQARPKLDRQYLSARNETESQLVTIWETVLGVRPIGIQDKFFDLGGHSMLAVRVIAQIEKAFGRKLKLATIFQAPTIERLASVLREEIKETAVAAGTSLVEIQTAGSRPPLFLVHGAGGGMFWGYVNLARRLGTDQPIYGFKSRGLDGHQEFASIPELAARYLADMRKFQPRGPYYLGGYCFGGNVAYEMACQLSEQGERVALLALMNCAPPHSSYSRIPWTPRWWLRFGRNLLSWANYFAHWSSTQRREFFRWKWQLVKKRLARRAVGNRERSRVEPGDLVDLSSYTEEQKKVWETHIRSLMQFHPRAYADGVHLFRSPGHPLWCSFEEDYGWGEMVKGGVQVGTVAGAHEKILEEPWVKVLAEQLMRALDEAQHRPVKTVLPDRVDQPERLAHSPSAEGQRPERPEPNKDHSGLTYPRLFELRRRHGEAVALRFGDQELSYHELDKRSNQLAHFLRSKGVGPEKLVAIAVDRSLDFGIAILGVLKAGGAYLPLDPGYPRERLALMLEDAKPFLLLTQVELLSKISAQSIETLCLDDPHLQRILSGSPAPLPTPDLAAENLAYVMYTSGSTGAPKGVEIAHGALCNHNLAIADAFNLKPGDRVLQFTALSFDISIEEIFPAWLSSSTVILRPDDIVSSVGRFLEFIASERVTVLNLPTAYWHELVEFLHHQEAKLPSSIRLVVIGGEKPSEQAFRRWKECVPGEVRLLNGYGATEATITSTLYEARPTDDRLFLGQPIANTYLTVLDEHLKPVTPGNAGELCLGGAGLARGYLNRPDATAAAFIPNPGLALVPSKRLYKTGDWVRVHADGALEFIGRRDEQVKVRGYRIELGEIETALRSHPAIKDAAAIVREAASGDRRLVGYFVPRESGRALISDLLAWVGRKLPAYMTPSTLVPLAQLPLTPAGKLDRQALPDAGNVRPELDQPFVSPATPLEKQLADIWSAILEVAPIGIHDDFIELGGHSLSATKLLARIHERLGVALTLAEFFERPTIHSLALFLAGRVGPERKLSPAALTDGIRLPLSPLQERIWWLDQLDPKQTAYNRAVGVKLSGPLDQAALQHSLSQLARRQDALRVIFPAEDGQPKQVVTSIAEVSLQTADLRKVPEPLRKQQALELAAQTASRSHMLSEPIFRALLLQLTQREHLLVLILNDIAADENSIRLVLHELPELYAAAASQQQASLPAPAAPYAHLVTTIPRLNQPEETLHLEYWKSQLGTVPELLDLPSDRPRSAQADYAGARAPIELAAAVAESVTNLAREQGCETFIVLLAALAAVLQRYARTDDVVIGTTVSLRSAATRDVVGPFENRVPVRCDLSGDPTFRQLLGRLSETRQRDLEHAAVPFNKIVAAVRPHASPSYTPIFQVFLNWDHEGFAEASAGELHFAPFEIDTHTSRYDLSLRLANTAEGVSGWIKYSTTLFDPARIERMIGHLESVLTQATRQPDLPLSKLELLSEEESRKLLVEWTATHRTYPSDKTLADLLREQVRRTPLAEALVCGQIRLSYSELWRRSAVLAGRLRKLGVEKESLVGVCLERSPEMVIAILGTLLAGGAYVPLDPKYPRDRLEFTLQDANVKVLVTQTKFLDLAPAGSSSVLCLDRMDELDEEAEVNFSWGAPSPSDLAYVIYTSGSTGRPKGVALEHRNAVEMVCWAKETFSPEELSGVLFCTSICFDLSVFELFVPLCWGGKVILAENALSLASLPAAGEVRLINTVPSAIRELLRLRAIPKTAQVINLAGEPLSTELVDQIYRETSVAKVFDLYGPTETTTYSTGGLRHPGQPATIGRPLANEQVYLLDSTLRLVPVGVPGELCIGGDGVARGYLNRPDLTAQRFIPHPFRPGGRLYRTGDLARWHADATLEYLGRIDHQVKIRGFRIELGEIESVLKDHSGTASAVVVAREDEPGDKRLVAYVVPKPGVAVTVEDLKSSVRSALPDFMVPSDFVLLEAMPLTPNGKIDRKALPAPGDRAEDSRRDIVAPRTTVERQLAEIWRDVLRLNQVSIKDNFFDLGGHSLLAVRVLSAIRDAFKVELPISALFSSPTIEGLSEMLTANPVLDGRSISEPIPAVPRTGGLPVSYVQERLWFLDQLEPGGAAYNVPTCLRLRGQLDIKALRQALNQVVDRHETLRTTFQYQDGALVQIIANTLAVEVPCLDLASLPAADQDGEVRKQIAAHARRSFDLTAGPLLRLTLFRLNPEEHFLLLVMHHSISDGWSVALFLQELAAFYDSAVLGGAPAQLPAPRIQYADFAHWQRHHMSGSLLEAELAHWKGTLAGAPKQIALPLDRPRPDRPSGRANVRSTRLERESVQQLTDFARHRAGTPFMVFLAALMMTLRKWTGQEDLVVGTVVAGRTRRELENIIGCFMNFLPLRAQVTDERTAAEILTAVRTAVLVGQSHQDCPFEKIVEAINPQRQRDQNPLYNVGLLLQNFPANLFETQKLQATSVSICLEAALLDLRFEIEQAGDGLSLTCEYKADLFDPQTIELLLEAWRRIIQFLVATPERRVSELELPAGLISSKPAAEPKTEPETIVVASTFTAEPVREPLEYWLGRLELPAEVEFAPYNQIFQVLLDPASVVGRNSRGLNIILARLEDWRHTVSRQPDSAAQDQSLERVAGEFLGAVKAAASRSTAPLLISLCPPSLRALKDSAQAQELKRASEQLEKDLGELPGVHVLSSEEFATWYPVADYYDAAGEELGAVPYTAAFFTALGTALARKFHALKRPAYKVVALDCDNTLWTGVCGEDGPNGIQLDAARRALQEFMRAQRESGMLLCLCSKNNEEDVQAVFSQRPEFPLRLSDLAGWRLNWSAKSANLKSLAQELGLGLDSFIFIDDNPVECAEVRANCPEVLTLQLPDDPAQIPQFLNHCWVFDRWRVTSEDKQRAEQYRQNRLREQLRVKAPTLEEFLASLELKILLEPIAPEHWARVSQLTQRTNQFNFTSRRLSEKDLATYLTSGEGLIVRVSDRFGDYGLVGAILFRPKGESLFVETFLLSCRVLGRGVEYRMVSRLGELARDRKLTLVDLKFVPSAKNKPALDFLEAGCREFQQPLNGGSVFRLPAGIALELRPGAQREEGRGEPWPQPTPNLAGPARFELCRAIALEANRVDLIQEQMRKSASVRTRSSSGCAAPKTELEKQLCQLWEELLRVQPVGVTDDFFELGGHSLLAVRLFAEIEKLLGRKFPLVTLFQAPTIEQLARVLQQEEGAGSLLVPIQPTGDKPPLFLVHGAGGDVLWGYANLAAHLPPDQPVFGIRSNGGQAQDTVLQLEDMARSYLEVVRARQPRGPYYLGGYCFGGNVAYEMARQLRMAGQEVALVVLLDSAPANAGYERVTWWRPAFIWHFAQNLRFWLADFIALQSEDRRRLIARKLRAVGRKLSRRLGFSSSEPGFDVEEVIDPRHFPEHELKLWQVHLEALIAHVERPYAGRVALLRTRGQPLFCSLENDFCWGKLIRGDFSVQRIPGSHENIFMEPNVRVLASELAQLLDRTGQTTSSAPADVQVTESLVHL